MYDTKSLDEYLKRLFDESGYPGISICLMGPEGIIFQKGYGFADIKKTRHVDSDTVYGIASMSKSFAALACAILQEEGKLSFSDPVTKYFPDFRIPGIPEECITLRHLAMHTTGLPPIRNMGWSISMNTPDKHDNYTRGMKASAPNSMGTIDDIIDYISNSNSYKLLGAPGEYMSYSNEGYALLSYVVDQASGMSLEEFLKVRVFNPLGMTRSVLDIDGSEAAALAYGNISELFDLDDDGKLYSDTICSVLPPYRGCACIKSTASDMAKYYLMLAQNGVYEGRQIIPAGAVEAVIGREFPETEKPFYCFGLEKRLQNNRVICEHSGGLHGVSSHGGLIRQEFDKPGYSMGALCNQGDLFVNDFVWPCYNLILDIPLNTRHYWAKPSGDCFGSPEMLTGKYMSYEFVDAYCIVEKTDDSQLKAEYQDHTLNLHYCHDALFSARTCEEPDKEYTTMEFYIRDGKAWGVKCYNRIYQRVE